ncbi:MAG: glycosyltransferase family 2 protein [Spirochaetes bacterium]|nr:glycosyltransferase family 2 protein [Spirochaetota bacterium]
MAAYNGEKYIGRQIESILNQTYENWELVIRDDGSTDETAVIVRQFCKSHHGRIKLISDDQSNLGSQESFNRLLGEVQSGYYMLSDQDDWWIPEKVEITYGKMKEIESKSGRDVPILLHTDLSVADKKLNIIAKSFSKYQNLKAARIRSFNRLLVQNVVSGCTVMINRALRDRALPIPPAAMMHDWWLALVASAFGIVEYVDHPTVLYRQHGINVVGAKEWGIRYLIKSLLNFEEKSESMKRTIDQAACFFQTYRSDLDEKKNAAAEAYSSITEGSFLRKRATLIKYRLFKAGFMRNLGMFCGV